MGKRIDIKNKTLYNKILKHKEFSSIITIVGVLLFAFIIIYICQKILIVEEKAPVTATISAEEYFHQGKYDKAIKGYEKLQVEEEWPIYNIKIAEILSVSGDIDKSNNTIIESVVKRNKIIDENGMGSYEDKDIEFGNYVALTFLLNGNYDKALEYGEFFKNQHSGNKELERTMFTIYMANNKLDEARDITDKYSVDLESSYDLAIYANMNMLVNKWDKGFEYLKKAWHENKEEIKVYDVIAQILAYNRKDTIKRITELSENNPDELCYKVWLANKDSLDKDMVLFPEIIEESGKGNVVEPYLREAVIKEPFNYNVIIRIANHYLTNEDNNKKAYRYFELASLLNHSDGETYYNMALIELKQGNEVKAIELLNKSISRDETSTKYHRALGNVFLNEGYNDEAIKQIRAAYATDENDILTLNNAGCYYFWITGNIERSMINFKAAYDGLTNSTDEYIREAIEDNYNKANDLKDASSEVRGEGIHFPEFTLLY